MSATATLPRLPLPKDRLQHLERLTQGLDAASLWWLSGYAAGLAGKAVVPDVLEARAVAEPIGTPRLTIVYIARYNRLRKVEPMQRALDELGVRTWIAGIRRSQSQSRVQTQFLELHDGRWKLHPIANWRDHDVWRYLDRHGLPYHPLWHEGYVSIGDVHTTRRWEPGMRDEDTRFFGLARECGLHL